MALDFKDLGSGSTEIRIQKLKELNEKAALGGGLDAIDRQHERNKLTARERIALLVDEDSFQEVGKFITSESSSILGDGIVTGFGTVDGKRVGIYSQDFTVQAGVNRDVEVLVEG